MTEIINRHHRFGACPHCGSTDGYLNHGCDHWFVCDTHMTKWQAGSGLFSSWEADTEEDWARNAAVLKPYEEVDPLPMVESDGQGQAEHLFDEIAASWDDDARQRVIGELEAVADNMPGYVAYLIDRIRAAAPNGHAR